MSLPAATISAVSAVLAKKAVDVPRTFIGFCEWLGVKLTPGQAEFARVAFDGTEPVDRDLAARIFGEDVPMGRRRVVAAICGRRAGKSFVFVALRLLHGMLVRELPELPAGTRAVSMIIAPRDSMRMEVIRYARGAIESKPELRAMVVAQTAESFELRRPDGKHVFFETGVATAGGTAARGRWFIDFSLDECCFFRDNAFKVNDDELYNAGSSALLPGGQVLLTSTPWGESGLLYRFWKERPPSAAVAHAPTLLLNDSPVTRAIVEDAEARDMDTAKREFHASFMTSGTTVFFESGAVDAAITDEPFALQPGDLIAAGADFGFRADSSALVMVALRSGVVHVFDGDEQRPGPDHPLKPSQTVRAFASKIAGRCSYLVADQHYREAIAEHLESVSLNYVPAPTQPADTYVRARMKMRELSVKIHPLPFRDRLIQQLREVHGKPTSGGGMSIVHPRWATGGHGDIAAAFVLALWQVTGDAVPAPLPSIDDRMKRERFERFKAEAERPHWRLGGNERPRHWRSG